MLKKLAVLGIAAFISISLPCLAGEGEGHKPGGEERLSRMQEHLDLSDEQVSQIRDIHERGGDRKEIGAVLTDGQREQMHEHRKNRTDKSRPKPEQSSD